MDTAVQRKLERNLRWARDHLRTRQFDRAQRYVTAVAEELEALPEDSRGDYAEQLAALRTEIEEGMRADRAETFMRSLDRAIDAGHHRVNAASDASKQEVLDDYLADLRAQLDSDDASCLSEAQRDEIQQRMEALQAGAAALIADGFIDNAERVVVRVEEVASGEVETRFTDDEDALFERCERHLDQCLDQQHSRVVDMRKRFEEARTRILVARQAGGHAEAVAKVVDGWQNIQQDYGSGAKGWQDEAPHDYQTWRSTRSLGLAKTEAALMLVARFRQNPGITEALPQCEQEPAVAETLEQVESMYTQAMAKIASAAVNIGTGAIPDAATNPQDLPDALRGLVDQLRRYGDDSGHLIGATAQIETALGIADSTLQSLQSLQSQQSQQSQQRQQRQQPQQGEHAARQRAASANEDHHMSYKRISSGWDDASAMASLNGKLYIIHSGTLYRVTSDGEHATVSQGWDGARLMTEMDGSLWIVHSGSLYRVED